MTEPWMTGPELITRRSSLPATMLRNCLRTWLCSLLALVGAPVCGQDDAATRAKIEDALAELDAAFAAGDAARFLAAFEPDHTGAHALLEQRMLRIFPVDRSGKSPYRRKSTILGAPRQLGPRTVARVRHELFKGSVAIAATLEDTMMAFRESGDTLVPTLAIETPRQAECSATDKFTCPACNYEVGGVAGWLCVPMGRDRAQALEASSFYLMGTDIACDVSVRIDDRRTAMQVVNELAGVLREVESDATPNLATNWLPPAHAGGSEDDGFIADLEGARIEIALPSQHDDAGAVAIFHALQFGSLQHLLLVRGSHGAIQKNRQTVDALLASFRLLDSNAERAAAGARALQMHVGGVVKDGRYDNGKHGASMQGPANWQVQQRCGGALFRVLWTGPDDSRIWLTGFAVPPGMDYWCQQTADHWVRKLCKSAGIEVPPENKTPDVDKWATDGLCDASVRTLNCQAPRQSGVPGKARRVLRVMFRANLLLVGDGTATTDEHWQLIKRSLGSMRL
ncbi:MAG: hypothetical protein NXI31_01995 [bacterium]|nr:hypothetical protein [bacterium]